MMTERGKIMGPLETNPSSDAVHDGTDLYRRIVTFKYRDEETRALQEKVWSPTPWVVDAFIGSPNPGHEHFERHYRMRAWLEDNIGDESLPIHNRTGVYHWGGSAVNGWSWVGFANEADMQRFIEAWPLPEGVTVPPNLNGGNHD